MEVCVTPDLTGTSSYFLFVRNFLTVIAPGPSIDEGRDSAPVAISENWFLWMAPGLRAIRKLGLPTFKLSGNAVSFEVPARSFEWVVGKTVRRRG